jgi:hypothetical protein
MLVRGSTASPIRVSNILSAAAALSKVNLQHSSGFGIHSSIPKLIQGSFRRALYNLDMLTPFGNPFSSTSSRFTITFDNELIPCLALHRRCMRKFPLYLSSLYKGVAAQYKPCRKQPGLSYDGIKECEQQSSNMATIHVRVSHNNNFTITYFFRIEV